MSFFPRKIPNCKGRHRWCQMMEMINCVHAKPSVSMYNDVRFFFDHHVSKGAIWAFSKVSMALFASTAWLWIRRQASFFFLKPWACTQKHAQSSKQLQDQATLRRIWSWSRCFKRGPCLWCKHDSFTLTKCQFSFMYMCELFPIKPNFVVHVCCIGTSWSVETFNNF